MNKNLTEFEEIFILSYLNKFTLDKKYFRAIYKTNLMKYDGVAVPEVDRGNVISVTGLFDAKSLCDAESKAPSHFSINPTFNALKYHLMEVEHDLVEVAEVKPPELDESQFKHINEISYGSGGALWIPVQITSDMDELPSVTWTHDKGYVRRSMPHFDSPVEDTTYLYHPWHGSSDDKYNDWYSYHCGDSAFDWLKNFFQIKHKSAWEKFDNTEFTDLDKDERAKVAAYQKLTFLETEYYFNTHNPLLHQGNYSITWYRDGRHSTPRFAEDPYNPLRLQYVTRNERIAAQQRKVLEVEQQLEQEKRELERLKKY